MPYTGPAAGVANWIKLGANTADYNSTGKVVTVEGQDVAGTGAIIVDANYGDDIRDFLVAVLDSVYKVYAAQTGDAIPTNFSIQRSITSTKIQFVVSVNIVGDVDFPALA